MSQQGQPALSVNGTSISDQTIALHQAAFEQNGLRPGEARKRATDKAVRDVLTRQEAARRGITVTDTEVDAFIESQRAANATAPAENRVLFDASLAGSGVTEAQYWSDPKTRAAVRAILTRAKLTAQLGGSPTLDLVLDQLKSEAEIKNVQ
jgi:hypothetical protein